MTGGYGSPIWPSDKEGHRIACRIDMLDYKVEDSQMLAPHPLHR